MNSLRRFPNPRHALFNAAGWPNLVKQVSIGQRYIHPRGPTKSLLVPDGQFDILFFGGDEFSCRTLEKLYEAKGESRCTSRSALIDINCCA